MKNEFTQDTKAYLRTTENINGYYDLFYLKNKKILTVIGSSDQIFEAVLRGASEVDGFDISKNAILFYYLKEAAIKTLNNEDYINFIYVENMNYTKEKYETIRDNLNKKVLEFWDKIFSHENYDIQRIINDMYIAPQYYMHSGLAEKRLSLLSAYIKKAYYIQLQRKINEVKINIVQRDIFDIPKTNKQYDYINFSNIFEYHDPQKFKKLIEEYKKYLTDNGIIIAGYAYHDADISEYEEYDKTKIPSRFMTMQFHGAPYDNILTTGKAKKLVK